MPLYRSSRNVGSYPRDWGGPSKLASSLRYPGVPIPPSPLYCEPAAVAIHPRDRLHAMDESLEKHAESFRPDLIGGLRVWTGPDTYVEVAYFTSETEAREGETKGAARRARRPDGRVSSR
jgi:hypothetical protein